MTLTHQSIANMEWWYHNVLSASNFIHPPPVDLTIFSDASLEGWGATDSHNTAGKPWDAQENESLPYINALEL